MGNEPVSAVFRYLLFLLSSRALRRDPPIFVSGTLVAEVYLKNLLFHTNVTGKHHEKLLIALAGAACLFTQITAAKADQLQDIEKRGVIRIVVPQDFPPFVRWGPISSRRAMTSIWRVILPVR